MLQQHVCSVINAWEHSTGAFNTCPYRVSYVSDQTSTSGILVVDVPHLTTEDSHHKYVEAYISFGCKAVHSWILLLLMVCLVLVLNRSSAIPVQQPKIQQDGGSISCKKPFTVIHHQLLIFLKTLNLLLKPRSYKYNMGITLNAF